MTGSKGSALPSGLVTSCPSEGKISIANRKLIKPISNRSSCGVMTSSIGTNTQPIQLTSDEDYVTGSTGSVRRKSSMSLTSGTSVIQSTQSIDPLQQLPFGHPLHPASSNPALSHHSLFSSSDPFTLGSKRKDSDPSHHQVSSFSAYLASRRGYHHNPLPNLQMLKLVDPSSQSSSSWSLNDANAASSSLSAPSSPTRASPLPLHYQTITVGESARFKVRIVQSHHSVRF